MGRIDDRGKPVLPKSERDPERDGPVRLPGEALSLLEARFLVRTSDRWVFATKNGTPYRPRNVQRWIRKVREEPAKKGVPLTKTFHSTRHFWVSGAIAAGWDWESIRGQAAHHSSAFTAKVDGQGTSREHSLDFAVPVVTKRSQRSQSHDDSVYTETPNQASQREKVERETGLEPATLSLGRESEPEEDQ